MKPGFQGPGPAPARSRHSRENIKRELLCNQAIETSAVFNNPKATANERHRALYALMRAGKAFAEVVWEVPAARRSGT